MQLSEDKIYNINTFDDIHDERDLGKNQNSSSTTIITQTTSKKLQNAQGDKSIPKFGQVIKSYIYAKSIVVIVENMQTSYKDKQAAIEARDKPVIAVALELSKT